MWFSFFLWALGGVPWPWLKTSSCTIAVCFKQRPKGLSSCDLLAVLEPQQRMAVSLEETTHSTPSHWEGLRNATCHGHWLQGSEIVQYGEEQPLSYYISAVMILISHIRVSDHNEWICNQSDFLLTGPDADGWRWVQITGGSKFWESLCTTASERSGYYKWEARTLFFYQLMICLGNHLSDFGGFEFSIL